MATALQTRVKKAFKSIRPRPKTPGGNRLQRLVSNGAKNSVFVKRVFGIYT